MTHFKQVLLACMLSGISQAGWAQSDWTTRNSKTSWNLQSATWADNQIVVCGSNGIVLTSPDGVTWTPRITGELNTLYSVGHFNSQFMAVGWAGTILASPDAVNWTRRSVNSQDSGYFQVASITSTDNQWVAVGSDESKGFALTLTSANGVSWAHNSDSLGSGGGLSSITWSGKQLTAVGYKGSILTSLNAVNWTERNSGATVDRLYGVVWADTQWVAVGTGGVLLTSPNGVSWTARNSGTNYALYSVAWTGRQLVAVGQAGTVLTSQNGATWTPRNSGVPNTLASVIWTGSQLVAVGDNGLIITSPQDPVSVFPASHAHANPVLQTAASRLTLLFPNSFAGERIRLAIYTNSGTRLLSARLSAMDGQASLPLDAIAHGWYWLETNRPGSRFVQAFRIAE